MMAKWFTVVAVVAVCGLGRAAAQAPVTVTVHNKGPVGKYQVLVVRDRMVSESYLNTVRQAVAKNANVVDEKDYIDRARSQGIPWYSDEAFAKVLPAIDVAVAIVVQDVNESQKCDATDVS